MAIADRITETQAKIDSAKADIIEYQSLLSQRDGLLVSVEDLKNQILTAELQHGNDQQVIAKLQSDIQLIESTLEAQIAQLEKEIADLKAQLAALPQGVVGYSDMEWSQFALNLKPDAASGRGNAAFTPADTGVPAMFSIAPFAPLTGDKDNYFNVYATQKKQPNAAIKNFVLTGQWDFPTDADMKQAHCIEMEARQVLKLVSPDPLPLMAVPAIQLNFSGNTFRYFDHSRESMAPPQENWVASGIPMPRQRSVAVEMEAHRDDKTLFYDAFTINGKRYPVSFQAPLYAKTYVNERLSVSLQLDSHYLAGPFKVSPSGVALKVW